MSSFTSLRSAIETKLGTISEIGEVKDSHQTEFDTYPGVTFEPSGHENNYFTNTDNERRYSFDIIVHQEMEHAGRDKAVEILASVVDAIVTAFDADPTLGGAADFCLALPSSWGEYTGSNGAVKFAQLGYVCVSEVQVIS